MVSDCGKYNGANARKRSGSPEENGELLINKRSGSRGFGDGELRGERKSDNSRIETNHGKSVRYMTYGRFVRQEREKCALRGGSELREGEMDHENTDARVVELGEALKKSKDHESTSVTAGSGEMQDKAPHLRDSPVVDVSMTLRGTGFQLDNSEVMDATPETLINPIVPTSLSSQEMLYGTDDIQQTLDPHLPDGASSVEEVQDKKHSSRPLQSQALSSPHSNVRDCTTEASCLLQPLQSPSMSQLQSEPPAITRNQDGIKEHPGLAEYESENPSTLDSGVASLFMEDEPTQEEVPASCLPNDACQSTDTASPENITVEPSPPSGVIDAEDQLCGFPKPAEPTKAPEIEFHPPQPGFGAGDTPTSRAPGGAAEELGASRAGTPDGGAEDGLEHLSGKEGARGTDQLDGQGGTPTPERENDDSGGHGAGEDDDGWSF